MPREQHKIARAVVMPVIQKHLADASMRTGIDKALWLRLVLADLAIEEPETLKLIGAFATNDWLALRIEEFIRSGRDPLVEQSASIDAIVKHAKQMDEVVQIQIAGVWQTKRVGDCTADELVTLGRQYIKTAATDERKGRFYVRLGEQMILDGFTAMTLTDYLKAQ